MAERPDLAQSRPEIDAVHAGLNASGLLGRPLKARVGGGQARAAAPAAAPPWAGQGPSWGVHSCLRAQQAYNFERGVRGDLWLHARGRPGAHALIKSAGREVDPQDPAGGGRPGPVVLPGPAARPAATICTDLRHVMRMKGGGPGMVQVREERNVQAVPLDPARLA